MTASADAFADVLGDRRGVRFSDDELVAWMRLSYPKAFGDYRRGMMLRERAVQLACGQPDDAVALLNRAARGSGREHMRGYGLVLLLSQLLHEETEPLLARWERKRRRVLDHLLLMRVCSNISLSRSEDTVRAKLWRVAQKTANQDVVAGRLSRRRIRQHVNRAAPDIIVESVGGLMYRHRHAELVPMVAAEFGRPTPKACRQAAASALADPKRAAELARDIERRAAGRLAELGR